MLQKRLLYLPRVSEASWNIRTNAARQGIHRQNDPLKNYCCLFTHRYKMVHLEKPVINPLFVGIVSFRGDDRIMSVSKGGEPDFEEFNLSSLYQMSQE
jgi:hypothetical protein